MGRPPVPDPIERSRVSRRELLEWLGRGAGLALFSPLLQACVDGSGRAAADVLALPDALPDAAADATADGRTDPGPADPGTPEDPGADGETPVEECGDTAFRPADAEPDLPQTWGERTVDKQDLAGILATWKLAIDGLVDHPRTFSFCELRDLGLVRQVTDFHCVEGWSIWDVPWDGVPLARLLDLVGPKPGAGWLKMTSVGGKYTESLSIAVAREPHTLLGLGIQGRTLPLKHGFPCRIVVPRLYGYKNAKYVERIEVVDSEWVGFWPSFGYTTSGEVDPSRLRPGKT